MNSSDDEDGLPSVAEEASCPVRLKATVEIYSEDEFLRQARPGGLFQPVSSRQGFLLDIDEDFFGCEPVAQRLYDVHLDQALLDAISSRVGKIFCGGTAEHELLSDYIFNSIIQFLIKNRYVCSKMGHLSDIYEILRSRCVISVYQHITERLQQKLISMNSLFVDSIFCGSENSMYRKSLLFELIKLLAPLKNVQLQAVAEVGICFQVSVHSFNEAMVGHLRLCDGYNRPNQTVVTFYTPTPDDIAARGKRLHRILGRLDVAPDVVTLCRSVRDGYTPRPHFRQIEDTVLNKLEAKYSESGGSLRVMYDRDLLGGKEGWWHRHGEARKHKMIDRE